MARFVGIEGILQREELLHGDMRAQARCALLVSLRPAVRGSRSSVLRGTLPDRVLANLTRRANQLGYALVKNPDIELGVS
jgi:hypothetical protein